MEAIVPKWFVTSFGLVVFGLFVALATTTLGKRPYIIFLAFWVFFAVLQARKRKLFPHTPDFALFMGWFFLACMAVGIGFMFYKAEFSN